MEPFKARISSILEIGRGNGTNLRRMCDFLDRKGEGIDSSEPAVKTGKLRFGSGGRIHLQTGKAAAIESMFFTTYCLDWSEYPIGSLHQPKTNLPRHKDVKRVNSHALALEPSSDTSIELVYNWVIRTTTNS
jgi:hypothetical protein